MLDPRIPLMAEGIPIEPRINALMRAGQMQGMQQQNAMREMQMQQLRQAMAAEQEQRKRQQAQQAMQEQLLLRAVTPVKPSEANAVSGVVGPRPEALSVVGQRRQVDPLEYLRAGFDPKMVEFIANAKNLGRPEVARVLDRTGDDGLPQQVQLDKYGETVGAAIPKPVESKFLNLGGTQQAYNPYQVKPGQTFRTTMTPGEIASDARARDRLAFERGQATADAGGPAQADLVKRFGKPPKDFRWKPDGSAEPIPGGPADVKATAEGKKAEARQQLAATNAGNVLDIVNEARNMVGLNTAGVGGVLSKLPATEARDLAAKLETVKANLGFDRLQAMREASPTGGALGAVAVQELTALQSTVASLDQLQSPTQLKQALDKIDKHYRNWAKAAGVELPKKPTLDPKAILSEADRIIGIGN